MKVVPATLAATISLVHFTLSGHALIPSSLSSRSAIRAENSLFASATLEATDDDIDSVEFPPPLSELGRFQRSALFWSKALPIVANYYGLIGSLKMQELLGENLAEETIEVCLRMRCLDVNNGAAFYSFVGLILENQILIHPKQ
jgi:hypothetical protein